MTQRWPPSAVHCFHLDMRLFYTLRWTVLVRRVRHFVVRRAR